MDNSKIVFLINDSVSAVRAQYEPETVGASPKTYVFKSFDPSVKVGDFAVVQSSTRFGLTVVKIIEINVDVDFDSPIALSWLLQKIDYDAFQKVLAQEADAVSVVQQAELRRKKAELRSTMFKDHEASINALALSSHHTSTSLVEPDDSAPDC